MSDPSRRRQLLALKLAALVRDHGIDEVRMVPGEFGIGAAVMAGTQAWVLLDTEPQRGLGPALAWAVRQGADSLQVVAESATGTLARRAPAFTLPIEVWHAEGRTLLPALPEPLPVPAMLAAEHEAFRAMIVEGGATPVMEHGVLRGEVNGLEVCRVVTDEHTGAFRLEVGVGAHDRETFQLLHGDRPKVEALAGVVEAVATHRRPGAPGHPLNRLARSRAVRARLLADPSLIGASAVEAVDPPVPRTNVKDDPPCVAIAVIDGRSTTVVCSAGVDLDVVPYAADARLLTDIEACIVVVPVGDDLRIQYDIAALLAEPIGIVALPAA